MNITFHVSADDMHPDLVRRVDRFEPGKVYLVKYRGNSGSTRRDLILQYINPTGVRTKPLFVRARGDHANWTRDDKYFNLPVINRMPPEDGGGYFEINDAVGRLMLPKEVNGQTVPGLMPEEALHVVLDEYKQQQANTFRELHLLHNKTLPKGPLLDIMSYREPSLPPYAPSLPSSLPYAFRYDNYYWQDQPKTLMQKNTGTSHQNPFADWTGKDYDDYDYHRWKQDTQAPPAPSRRPPYPQLQPQPTIWQSVTSSLQNLQRSLMPARASFPRDEDVEDYFRNHEEETHTPAGRKSRKHKRLSRNRRRKTKIAKK